MIGPAWQLRLTNASPGTAVALPASASANSEDYFSRGLTGLGPSTESIKQGVASAVGQIL